MSEQRADQASLNQAVALAGMYQALSLVKQIAWKGEYDQQSMQCSLGSVLKIDAANVIEVFNSLSNLHSGLHALRDQLNSNPRSRDIELSRYAGTILILERKLINNDLLMHRLRQGIQATSTQLEHLTTCDQQVITRLADLYSDTVSKLSPRVLVNGDQNLLEQTTIANQIRAALLAAIRATVLWRQVGGTKLSLLLGRRRLLNATAELIR